MIKGLASGDPWDEFRQLGLQIAARLNRSAQRRAPVQAAGAFSGSPPARREPGAPRAQPAFSPRTSLRPWLFLALHQALTRAIFADDHQTQFAIDPSLAVPVTAGGANFHFSGQDQFFFMVGKGKCILCGQHRAIRLRVFPFQRFR
jgi:hypothetical protein